MSKEIKSLQVIAPGKVILHGEHAVVYGKRAIAVSVGLYTKVSINPSENVQLNFMEVQLNTTLDLQDLNQLRNKLGPEFRFDILNNCDEIPITEEVKEILLEFCNSRKDFSKDDENLRSMQIVAFQSFLFLYLGISEELMPLCCQINTELPVGAGLGSSASFAVALAGGLLLSAKREPIKGYNVDTINRWAFVSEKFVHGSPSGVDNSVASFGGGIGFMRGKPLQHLVGCPDIHALLVNTKISRSTKILVAKVAALKETDPEIFGEAMEEIDAIVGKCVTAIEEGNGVNGELISRNQELLTTLGVSHPALDLIVKLAQNHGLSAKLTGAGGGGCAFIYIPPNYNPDSLQPLLTALRVHRFEFWDTVLGCKGFTVC